MGEWIRFWIVAVLLFSGVFCYVMEVIGIFRFGYVLNRMHASGVGDSLAFFLVVLALMIASGWNLTTLKLLLLILFMWLTSPTSTHFLSLVEMNTNPYLDRHVLRRKD